MGVGVCGGGGGGEGGITRMGDDACFLQQVRSGITVISTTQQLHQLIIFPPPFSCEHLKL